MNRSYRTNIDANTLRMAFIYTRFQNYATFQKNNRFYVVFTAENSKRKMNTILSKKTNIEQKQSRYANKNKQQTSTEEIYIENDFQT